MMRLEGRMVLGSEGDGYCIAPLEEREWVESFWGTSDKGKRAKFYRLTTAGRRALKNQQSMWEQYVVAVAGVIALRPQEATT